MLASSRNVWGIYLVFFAQSAVLGSWIPRIPDIKDDLQLSSFVLGVCMLALSAGTMLAFFIAGSVIERFGLRRASQFSVAIWALLFILPGFANSAAVLFGALFLCGIAVGHCEGRNEHYGRCDRAKLAAPHHVSLSWVSGVLAHCSGR